MRVQEQTTIAKAASASGMALHAGVETRIVLRPAPAGAGILFRRMDLKGERGVRRPANETTIAARPQSVVDAKLGVRLQNSSGASVMTVEHLLAGFVLCGVDNALVEVYGPEIPAFDGSTAPIIHLIEQAGVRPLAAAREAIEARANVRVEDGERFIEMSPSESRLIEVSIDFADEAIGRQTIAFSLDEGEAPIARLASARTFCMLRDVEPMQAAGFGRGGSLENSIVVDGGKVLNPSGLRDPQEYVLHKALDLIGDLSLLGAPIYGLIRAHKPGHDLNTRFAKKIASDLASVERRVIAREEARLTA